MYQLKLEDILYSKCFDSLSERTKYLIRRIAYKDSIQEDDIVLLDEIHSLIKDREKLEVFSE